MSLHADIVATRRKLRELDERCANMASSYAHSVNPAAHDQGELRCQRLPSQIVEIDTPSQKAHDGQGNKTFDQRVEMLAPKLGS